MNNSPPTFVVRHRLWWVCLRLALCLQCLLFVIFCAVIGYRGAISGPLLESGDGERVFHLEMVINGVAALIGLIYWWFDRHVLSVEGIHRWPPDQPNEGRVYIPRIGVIPAAPFRPFAVPTIYWCRVSVVQRQRGWLGGRWLRIVPEYGEPITLPERPADFDGFRAAVERFAGPDHPLTRALADVTDEGA